MNIIRAIKLSAVAAVTLMVAACSEDSTSNQTSSESNAESTVASTTTNNQAVSAVVSESTPSIPKIYTAEFIQSELIPAFKELAPIKIDEDMSITRLEADERKLFYVLDFHPRARKAVIPAEMQEYLGRLSASACRSASNKELISKVDSLGYRMEYQGQKIAEVICK